MLRNMTAPKFRRLGLVAKAWHKKRQPERLIVNSRGLRLRQRTQPTVRQCNNRDPERVLVVIDVDPFRVTDVWGHMTGVFASLDTRLLNTSLFRLA